ncbi:NAD(P)-binding protein [Mycena amicta]|nr:NAD(P)-binding protein [Mycena amicta]
MTIAQDISALLVAVVGATGVQGGSVIRALIESDKSYRFPAAKALTDKGVEVVVVSLETTEGKLMVDAAKGVQGIIWSALPSMAALSGGKYTQVSHFETCNPGVPFVNIQAGSYASNYLNVMRPTGITDVWAVSLPPSPSSAMYLIDADLDYGLFVRRAIEAPVFPDKQTFATWGEEITIQDRMEQISQVTGKKVIYNQITPEVFADGLKSAGLPPHILPALTEAFPAFDEFGCSAKDAIFSQEGLGRKPRTWRQFVQVADWSSVLV